MLFMCTVSPFDSYIFIFELCEIEVYVCLLHLYIICIQLFYTFSISMLYSLSIILELRPGLCGWAQLLHTCVKLEACTMTHSVSANKSPKPRFYSKLAAAWTAFIHSKTPHVVTVLWLDSDDVVTILSSTRNLVEGYKTVYLCHLDSYTVTVCNGDLSSHAVTVSCLLGA